ncbi:hypothetical protein H0H93_012230 [Arthromyces matolae]|nr:hypothetical protein H0H93_012230 [Arthromyces matolae]
MGGGMMPSTSVLHHQLQNMAHVHTIAAGPIIGHGDPNYHPTPLYGGPDDPISMITVLPPDFHDVHMTQYQGHPSGNPHNMNLLTYPTNHHTIVPPVFPEDGHYNGIPTEVLPLHHYDWNNRLISNCDNTGGALTEASHSSLAVQNIDNALLFTPENVYTGFIPPPSMNMGSSVTHQPHYMHNLNMDTITLGQEHGHGQGAHDQAIHNIYDAPTIGTILPPNFSNLTLYEPHLSGNPSDAHIGPQLCHHQSSNTSFLPDLSQGGHFSGIPMGNNQLVPMNILHTAVTGQNAPLTNVDGAHMSIFPCDDNTHQLVSNDFLYIYK